MSARGKEVCFSGRLDMVDLIPHSSSAIEVADFAYVGDMAKRNFVGRGPLCAQLEERLARTFKRSDAVLTDSGEDALSLVLHLLRDRRPACDEVVISAYSCVAVLNAILSGGLKPVFADVTPDSLNLDFDDVRSQRMSPRTLAIVCQHMGGYPDDLRRTSTLGVPVISDGAQGIGARLGGRSVLEYGDFAVASFGSTKFITGGTGGAVLCGKVDAESMRRLAAPELSVAQYREHGFARTLGQHVSDLNAGLTLAQLNRLDHFVDARRRIARRYDDALMGSSLATRLDRVADSEPNGFRYCFLTDRAADWQQRLVGRGIDARTSISHLLAEYFPGGPTLPQVARQAARLVSVPIYPALDDAQTSRIEQALRDTAAKLQEAA
jgi:perosamine synthetase